MNSLAIVTIVSNNYLHFARTLMQSVAQQHPDADRYCVIVDRDMQYATELVGEFQAIELNQLKLPDGDDFLFQYNVLELNTAVKPWALQHLLEQGYQKIVYIDPDITLYRPLTAALDLLSHAADIVFTPHLLSPVTDDLQPTELDIRRAGTYNLGFCALGNTPNSISFLSWWQKKLHRDCIIAHDKGIFVDQSWMDLVPGIFPGTAVLRHPGYNVAYWNLAQRTVDMQEGQLCVNGEPLVFYHFSGLNPLAPHPVSKHQNRFTLKNMPTAVAELINDYCQRVKNNDIERYKAIDYGFACYEEGTPIRDAHRSCYRTNEKLRSLANGAPFRHPQLIAEETSLTSNDHGLGGANYLQSVYTYLLDRSPDRTASRHYAQHTPGTIKHLRLMLAVALSAEARARPGWIQRLVCWPMRHALTPNHRQDAPARAHVPVPEKAARPRPYEGLSAPEPDSAENGLWVGPCLNLPICKRKEGKLQIRGYIDTSLLRRGGNRHGQQLHIHGTQALLHSAQLKQSGTFTIELNIPPNAFAEGSQWSIVASAHTVPKNIGLGEDTRKLAWRVQHISLDDQVLVDSRRTPATLSIEQLSPPNGLNLIGYLSAELGLGEAVRSLASACVAQEIPFSAIDVGYQSSNQQRDTRIATQAVKKHFPIDLIYVNADQTAATAAYLEQKHQPGLYRIGFWHWEQPRLPDSTFGAFAHVDEIWVPSTFVHDAVAPFSPVPVVKIPHAIEFSPSTEATRSRFGLPEEKQLALVMYDFHSYQYRKNPQAAIEAFRIAAGHRDDTALVIKTINSQHHPEARAELHNSVTGMNNVIFIDQFLTRQQVWDLQSCCDFLISLHRAEGFGLAPAEMMYLGKPVIATGWSANMDFMTAQNAFPVRYQLKPLERAVGVYPAGPSWAEADIDHAAQCITQLLDAPDLRQRMGQQAAQDIRNQLSPSAVGALVRERLSLLSFWHPELRPVDDRVR